MSSLILFPLLSLAVTIAALWLLLHSGLAVRLAMDEPNHRSLHTMATPRIGGLVLVPAFLLSWLNLTGWQVVLLLVALLALLSYVDDRSGLPVMLRLVAQLAAAALFVKMKLDLPGVLWMVAAVLWIGWCANLYNFMDGADGLAGGMALFGFSAYGLAAYSAGGTALATACLSVAAAAAGFLLFNFPPAKTFMGDAGSVSLGFLAGALGLLGWQAQAWPLWFPLLVFSPFIVDATATLLMRARRRERVWQAHRDHYYQRLVRMGWSHRRLALTEYGLMAACTASALCLIKTAEALQYLGLAVWLSIYALAMITADSCWKKHQRKTRQP